VPLPDPAAAGNPHTRLRWDIINGRIYQGRQFKENGVPDCDIDFTAPTTTTGELRRKDVAIPHKQDWVENIPGNSRSGYKRSKQHKPLEGYQ
jgi:hypothetical protein